MKLLYEAKDSIEAHLIRNLLSQQHIEARVDGDFLQGGVGEIQAFGFSRVMVAEQDYYIAKQLIKEWEQGLTATIEQEDISDAVNLNNAVDESTKTEGNPLQFFYGMLALLLLFLLAYIVGNKH